MTRILVLIAFLTSTAAAAPRIDVVIPGSKTDKSRLDTPFAIELDAAGNGYIVELDGGRVHNLDPSGNLTTMGGAPGDRATRGKPADPKLAYTGDGGPVASATFNGMHNLAVNPDGNLYLADTWNNVVRKVDHKTGLVTTFAGTGEKGYKGDGGPASKAAFNGTFCVTFNPAFDTLHVTDLGNKRIRAIDMKTGAITTVAGNGKSGAPPDAALAKASPLTDPRAAAADRKGNLYILERGGHALRMVSPDGKIKTVAGRSGKAGKADGSAEESSLNGPKHLCIDHDDNVIIADAENHLVRRYDAKTGKLSTPAITGLNRPHGVTVHRDGSLYVVDSYNHRVLKVTGF